MWTSQDRGQLLLGCVPTWIVSREPLLGCALYSPRRFGRRDLAETTAKLDFGTKLGNLCDLLGGTDRSVHAFPALDGGEICVGR